MKKLIKIYAVLTTIFAFLVWNRGSDKIDVEKTHVNLTDMTMGDAIKLVTEKTFFSHHDPETKYKWITNTNYQKEKTWIPFIYKNGDLNKSKSSFIVKLSKDDSE